MRLIGLSGLAGSGKDTVRGILEQRVSAWGLAFADPLRAMIRPLLVMLRAEAYMDDRALKEAPIPGLGVSYRVMMQRLGTEWGRGLRDDFWLRTIERRLEGLRLPESALVVVSDVRFPNEAAWVRQQGGQVWLINRPGVERVAGHESEEWAGRMDEEVTLHNTDAVADLERLALIALRHGR